MNRRTFLSALAATPLAALLPTEAQAAPDIEALKAAERAANPMRYVDAGAWQAGVDGIAGPGYTPPQEFWLRVATDGLIPQVAHGQMKQCVEAFHARLPPKHNKIPWTLGHHQHADVIGWARDLCVVERAGATELWALTRFSPDAHGRSAHELFALLLATTPMLGLFVAGTGGSYSCEINLGLHGAELCSMAIVNDALLKPMASLTRPR